MSRFCDYGVIWVQRQVGKTQCCYARAPHRVEFRQLKGGAIRMLLQYQRFRRQTLVPGGERLGLLDLGGPEVAPVGQSDPRSVARLWEANW